MMDDLKYDTPILDDFFSANGSTVSDRLSYLFFYVTNKYNKFIDTKRTEQQILGDKRDKIRSLYDTFHKFNNSRWNSGPTSDYFNKSWVSTCYERDKFGRNRRERK